MALHFNVNYRRPCWVATLAEASLLSCSAAPVVSAHHLVVVIRNSPQNVTVQHRHQSPLHRILCIPSITSRMSACRRVSYLEARCALSRRLCPAMECYMYRTPWPSPSHRLPQITVAHIARSTIALAHCPHTTACDEHTYR